MSNKDSKPDRERRSTDRTAEDAGWEAKVLGRLSRRVTETIESPSIGEPEDFGWEQKSVEVLRSRMKRDSD